MSTACELLVGTRRGPPRGRRRRGSRSRTNQGLNWSDSCLHRADIARPLRFVGVRRCPDNTSDLGILCAEVRSRPARDHSHGRGQRFKSSIAHEIARTPFLDAMELDVRRKPIVNAHAASSRSTDLTLQAA